MKNNLVGINRIVSLTMSLSAVCLLTISCASKPTMTGAQESDSANFQNLVHGKLVNKNGSQPIAGATVYIPKTANPKVAAGKKPLANLSLNSVVEHSMGCPVPDEPYTSFACTDHFGNFTLSLLNASLDDFKLKIQYEDATVHTDLALNDLDSDLGIIEFDLSQSDHKEKIAIVLDLQSQAEQMSNSFDGTISNTMKVEFEQEFSKMYDIDEDQYDVEFLPFPSLFEDKDDDKRLDIFNYKMIYLITPGDEDLSDVSKENKLALLDYISKGGELFVTTLSVEVEDASLEEYI
jgi:hypothetical protein